MQISTELPDLEKTLIEMVVELLIIEKEKLYPDLIYGSPERKPSVRITMHYIMALLAYGFSANDVELVKGAEWFDKPFPKQRQDVIDTIEMNRLTVLLYLRPERETVKARLKQLIRQQANNQFDVQPAWGLFDTLWALKVLTLAKQKQVLTDDIITISEIKERLNGIIVNRDLQPDKDKALALRLQYDLFGQLEPAHLDVLNRILALTENSGGMWGMREFMWQLADMPWYQQLLEGRPLVYDDIADYAARFRKIIVSTCMVIEYLSPLMADYPFIRAPLKRAVTLWWQQFSGPNAIPTLRGMFSKEHDYDYLLVLCRTLRALREYIGQPLRTLDTVHMLRELTHLKTNATESLEIRNIKQALRSWLHFDLAEPPEKLRLGYSESNVVRIVPHIWSPMANFDTKPTSLIDHSLIIKYGPTEEINKERESYENLPAATRDYFVRIPEASYTDSEHGISYVIMQDLRDYKTLYEVVDIIGEHGLEITDQLGTFLRRMHEGGTSQLRPVSKSLFRELYLGRMLENIDRVFNFVLENASPNQRENMRNVQYHMFELIGEIFQHQRHFETFPQAYMHGDLHMRNIMVAGTESRHSVNHRGTLFKLIDLEFMRADGDAAFDAGEIIIDLELVSRETRALGIQKELMRMSDSLERMYRQFSESRSDDTFNTRLELAKARALLRIGKGKTKRGQKLSENKNTALLGQLCEELVTVATEACNYLQTVVNAIRT